MIQFNESIMMACCVVALVVLAYVVSSGCQ
jgi:hypothetical protein